MQRRFSSSLTLLIRHDYKCNTRHLLCARHLVIPLKIEGWWGVTVYTGNPSTWTNKAGEVESNQACRAKSYQRSRRIKERESTQDQGQVAYLNLGLLPWDESSHFLGSLSVCDLQGVLLPPQRTRTSLGTMDTTEAHRTGPNQRRGPFISQKNKVVHTEFHIQLSYILALQA